jgi:hypothetical protein
MRAGFLKQSSLTALMTLSVVLGGFETVRAGDGQHGEKIEFSEVPVQGPVVVSNLNKLNADPGGFKQVKEDLLRPFDSLDPRNSLDMSDFMNGQFPPPRQPNQPAINKHAQQLQDERKNWAFSAYEQLFSGQDNMEKQMFGIKEYGDDGREKKDLSSVEKYYQSLDEKNLSATNQNARTARAEFINKNGFDPLGRTFDSSDPFLKRMLGFDGPESLSEKEPGDGSSEAGGLTFGSPQEIQMTQRRLFGDAASQFPKLGEQYNPLMPQDYYNTPKSPADNSLKDAAELKPKRANPFLAEDPTANVLHSHVNDDLTARALGLPNPVTPLTNSAARPAPTAQSIQAEWDPFGANRMKPKF